MADDELASHGGMTRFARLRTGSGDLTPHACGCLKCALLPCIPCAASPVLCCCCVRSPRHELWGKNFEAALAMLHAGTGRECEDVLLSALSNRITSHMQVIGLEAQCGFMPGKTTVDAIRAAIYTVWVSLQMRFRFQKDTWGAFRRFCEGI